jgi:hypothetical protein
MSNVSGAIKVKNLTIVSLRVVMSNVSGAIKVKKSGYYA